MLHSWISMHSASKTEGLFNPSTTVHTSVWFSPAAFHSAGGLHSLIKNLSALRQPDKQTVQNEYSFPMTWQWLSLLPLWLDYLCDWCDSPSWNFQFQIGTWFMLPTLLHPILNFLLDKIGSCLTVVETVLITWEFTSAGQNFIFLIGHTHSGARVARILVRLQGSYQMPT